MHPFSFTSILPILQDIFHNLFIYNQVQYNYNIAQILSYMNLATDEFLHIQQLTDRHSQSPSCLSVRS